MPLLTNMLRVLILLMIAIQQKTSTLRGTRPLQIPLKKKTVYERSFEAMRSGDWKT